MVSKGMKKHPCAFLSEWRLMLNKESTDEHPSLFGLFQNSQSFCLSNFCISRADSIVDFCSVFPYQNFQAMLQSQMISDKMPLLDENLRFLHYPPNSPYTVVSFKDVVRFSRFAESHYEGLS
jgi:hypothetical protein